MTVLREGLARYPDAAVLHHALGLALVRQKHAAEGLKALRMAGACVIAGLLAASALPALAAPAARNVLALYGPTRLLPAVIEGDRGIREALESSAERRIDFYAEHLDVPRFGGETSVRTVATFLREKYATHPPDVIIEFWRFVFVQDQVAKLAMTAVEFPPMQKGASFNLDAVKAKIEAARAAMGK